MQSVDERVTEQFRRWAFRGQGMELWKEPVTPEPAFLPFRGYDLSTPPVLDDGRREGLLGSVLRRMFVPAPPSRNEPDEPQAVPRESLRGELTEIQILSPKDVHWNHDASRFFLTSLSSCVEPLTCEFIADCSGISLQLASHPRDVPLIREELAAFFPGCVPLVREGALRQAWYEAEADYFAAVEFGLSREFMRPLEHPKLDPYMGLVGALSELGEGEFCLFQAIFEPVVHPWAEHAFRSVSYRDRKPIFENAPELVAETERKTASPLYAAVVRVLARSTVAGRVNAIVENVAAALRVLDDPDGNALIPLPNGEYSGEMHVEDALSRQSRRSGMILNADELGSLVHIPSRDVLSPKLVRLSSTTKAAPETLWHNDGVLLGHNTHAGLTVPVSLGADERVRHMHVVGASGTGKTTLLYNLIRQDIERGEGLALFDPHGDLVDRVLGSVPPERIHDVVLLDPSDLEYPVGFNILQAHSELEKTLLASDLVSVFERLSEAWGDQMDSVLRHAVLAFLESKTGGSLVELRRFLLEPDYRASFLESVTDPEVVYYWQKGFPQLTGNKSIGPILTRLETFLAPKSIRYMVAQRDNRLDFADILDTGKIFLAKLSQGTIGRENSYLLGTLLLSKFQQLAMARQAQSEGGRRDFFLYADEFQNFITPSMAEILSGARKYRLGFVLAHQELRQLERNREVASAVLSNPYTRIVFRVGDADARALESGFSHFGGKDLQNLGTGEAICRVERSDYDFNLTVSKPLYPSEGMATKRRREVVGISRRAYGRPRAEVEAMMKSAQAQFARPEPPLVPRPIVLAPRAPVVVPAAAEPEPKPTPPTPASPGRGGREHKYLQTFIKQWAEGMGWRTTIEAEVTGGSGSVDVLLAKDGVTIACEISVTTSVEHEIGNLKKCVVGRFTHIVSVSADEKRAGEIEAAAKQALEKEALSRVRFLTPQKLFSFVEEITAKSAAKETTVKGYRVKVNYKPVDGVERVHRSEQIAAVVAKSLKRMKTKETE